MKEHCTSSTEADESANEKNTLSTAKEGVRKSSFSSLHCKRCTKSFNTQDEFEAHVRKHVELPDIIVQALTRSYVLQLKANNYPKTSRKSTSRAVARKRTYSYIVPKRKSLKTQPLKLTLKLLNTAAKNSPSFEVVPPKILIGPGGVYPENGIIDQVKTEVVNTSEEVEGSGEEQGEGRGKLLEQPAPVLDSSKGDTVEGLVEEEREEASGAAEEEKSDIEDSKESLDEELHIPISACPSPSPSEQLRPEFLAPEEDSCDSTSAMVEVSGSTLNEARSPAFPSSSPAPPGSGDSNSQHSTGEQTQATPPEVQASSVVETNAQGTAEDRVTDQTASETSSFNWNDVNSANNENDVPIATNGAPMEERDPLLLPDQSPGERDMNESSEGSASHSLLRGFLCDSNSDGKNTVTTPPTTVVAAVDGLGSEYISLERLGETSALATCEVCGERSSNIEEHRALAGHYSCELPECSGVVFVNRDEVIAHRLSVHGTSNQTPNSAPQQIPSTQQYTVHHQPPPVQQLAQQVQRLPIPPSQQMSPHQMVQHMQPQQLQMMQATPVRLPPPLFRVPGSAANATGLQHPYPQQQQQRQMYGQQAYPPQQNMARQYMVQQGRPRAPLQRPNLVQQQVPRGGMQQKRQTASQPGGSPSNKQRRLDMLLPDRHDDADCHVIAMQKRTDSGPVIGNVQGANNSRPESMIHLTDSITLSVRQSQANAAQSSAGGTKNKSDAKTVANILATRGITVTPAGGAGGGGAAGGAGGRNATVQQSAQQLGRQSRINQQPMPVPTQPVTTLNLNSAISIIAQPTAASSRQQGNFAVPQGRGSIARTTSHQQQVERPPRPPTVDLTGDGPPPPLHGIPSRGRGRGRVVVGRHTCQVCDKAFSTQDSLNQHMALHRSPGKLPYRCSLCSAQYPNQQGLLQHRQTFHKEPVLQPGAELALPVVDLKQPGALNRLAGLGVHHYIPLSQLGSQAGGYFSLPIVSVDGARNPAVCNLGALGATSVLSIGPIKSLGR